MWTLVLQCKQLRNILRAISQFHLFLSNMMCCHLLGRAYWLKRRREHECRDQEQRAQEWVKGMPPKGSKHDYDSLQFRHKLSHWAISWQSDKGNSKAMLQDGGAAMVTVARLALGDGHMETAGTLLSGKEHLFTWIHSQVKCKSWFQVVQNWEQLMHTQVLKCQILIKLQSPGNSLIRSSRRFLKTAFF